MVKIIIKLIDSFIHYFEWDMNNNNIQKVHIEF